MGMAIIYGLKVAAMFRFSSQLFQVNISVAMVAMVNHTAVASLHGDEHDIVANLQEARGGNATLQERNLTGDGSWVEPGGGEETASPHQVDGPFVWQTTVSWNNLKQ